MFRKSYVILSKKICNRFAVIVPVIKKNISLLYFISCDANVFIPVLPKMIHISAVDMRNMYSMITDVPMNHL